MTTRQQTFFIEENVLQLQCNNSFEEYTFYFKSL